MLSEREVQILYESARGVVYAGIAPDTLADEWVCFRNFDVIFEGDWPSQH